MNIPKITILILCLFTPLKLFGVLEPTNPPEINAQLISNVRQIPAGETVQLGIHLDIEKDWHIYWKNSGDAGFPTQVDWKDQYGLEFSEIEWPKPNIYKEPGNITTIGYKDETMLLSTLIAPSKSTSIKANVSWLACKIVCIPGEKTVELPLIIGQKTIINEENQGLINSYREKILSASEEKAFLNEFNGKKSESNFLSTLETDQNTKTLSIWVALLFAFLGGLLLNIMPCVLPVLSIKALRILNQSRRSHKQLMKETFFFSIGILISFLVLAALVVSFKSVGQEIGWGFQFQEPRYVIALTTIVFTFGLSLFGVYEFSILVPSKIQKLSQKKGVLGSFWEGVLATALATPCTAPFLGPALGFSFSQKPLIIFIFFAMIAAGLATPYKLMALFPKWTRWLPKPGAWMETFKQLMGFPLIATAIWLLWVLSRQVGSTALIATLVILLLIGMGMWAYRHKQHPFISLLFIGLIMFTYTRFVEPSIHLSKTRSSTHQESKIQWKPFSLQALEDSIEIRDPVFIDFTAEWCLTCQFNKNGVLSSEKVANAFKENGVVPYRADWTNRNDEITRVLKKLGRSGVPVYVYFFHGDTKNPIILPELLTEKHILDPLAKI